MSDKGNDDKTDHASRTGEGGSEIQERVARARLASVLTGLVAGGCLASGAVVRSYHADAPALAFFVLGLLSSALVGWFAYKYEYKKSADSFAPTLILFMQMAAVVLCAAVGATWAELFPNTLKLLRQASIFMNYVDDPRSLTAVGLVVPWHTIDRSGTGIYNIDLLTETELVNLEDEPRHFRGYWLEVRKFDLFWTRMCEVDLQKGDVYMFAPGATAARVLKYAPLSPELSHGIAPKASVVGWTAWQCPAFDCRRAKKRFVVEDLDGHREYLSLSQTDRSAPEKFDSSGTFSGGPPKQIDWSSAAVLSSAFCSGQTVP